MRFLGVGLLKKFNHNNKNFISWNNTNSFLAANAVYKPKKLKMQNCTKMICGELDLDSIFGELIGTEHYTGIVSATLIEIKFHHDQIKELLIIYLLRQIKYNYLLVEFNN